MLLRVSSRKLDGNLGESLGRQSRHTLQYCTAGKARLILMSDVWPPSTVMTVVILLSCDVDSFDLRNYVSHCDMCLIVFLSHLLRMHNRVVTRGVYILWSGGPVLFGTRLHHYYGNRGSAIPQSRLNVSV